MTRQLSIQDAARHFNVSEKTIRRRIKQGKLKAEQQGGRWIVQIDGTDAQMTDWTDCLIGQFQSEITHLRDQLTRRDGQIESLTREVDHLTQLLAVSQKTIGQLTDQNRLLLEDTRKKPSLWQRLRGGGKMSAH